MRANQHGVGVDDQKIFRGTQGVPAHFQQLLEQPPGSVPFVGTVTDVFFRDGKNGIFIDKLAFFSSAKLDEFSLFRSDDPNVSDRMLHLFFDRIDDVRKCVQIFLDGGYEHIDSGSARLPVQRVGHLFNPIHSVLD